jgi:pyruvate/2-oxoglutarate dehydrogenase complex dihydrolipoamide dehydrogenase (E3) component
MSASDPADRASFDDKDSQALTERLRLLVDIRDRRHGFPPRVYPKCFVGTDAVRALVAENMAADVTDAIRLGNMLLDAGAFHHVLKEHAFKNEELFYRFAVDEDHGAVATTPDGTAVSWADFLAPLTGGGPDGDSGSLQAAIPARDPQLGQFRQDDLEATGVSPLDAHNTALLDCVRPKRWVNPSPKGVYNLVVIGAGAGGLVTSAGAAGLGARVALIESHLLGGDCLNVGCVPSKALIRCARAAAAVREAGQFGVRVEGPVSVDFGAVMERMRRLRAEIAPNDSAERFSRDLGIDVFIGSARFTGEDTVEVGGETLRFKKAVVATGGTAAVPPIPGLDQAPYLTNATVFNLTALPKRLGVIGAGPIGMELAQAFRRFGADVTAFSRDSKILPKEDVDAAALVQASMARDGVRFAFNVTYRRVDSVGGQAPVTVVVERDGQEESHEFDALLVATGRKPNVTGLGLDLAGVRFDPRSGVEVNDKLQTSNPNVFAVGDVASRYQFTHMADFMARMVIRNALFLGRDKVSSLLVPWATYTEPEVAHVGLYERDLEERGIAFATYTRQLVDVDRAILEGDTEGFVKIHVKKGTDDILGATIVGAHAGDLISEISVAMRAGMGLGTLASVIHPYPTTAEAIRQTGDAYNRTRLTPVVKRLFHRWLSLGQ